MKTGHIFEKDLSKRLSSGEISYGAALLLSGLSRAKRSEILRFLKNFYLGSNKMKEVVENLIEISEREHLPLSRLLGRKEIRSIVMNRQKGEKSKGEDLRRVLRRWRYPVTTEKENRIRAITERIRRGLPLRVVLAQNWEKREISIILTVSASGEWRRLLKELPARSSDIDELLKTV